MRTINADALKDILQNLAYADCNHGTTTLARVYKELIDMVDEEPTVNATYRNVEVSSDEAY